MRSATPEAHMVVWRSRNVETVRLLELVFVPVRRDVPHDYLVTSGDRSPPDLSVDGGRPPEVQNGTGIAHDLVDRCVHQANPVSLEPVELVGIGQGMDLVDEVCRVLKSAFTVAAPSTATSSCERC